ncbi:AraC-like DNA-binding protein [Pullulanibacillus pueri]|uniref:AraC family transcriptional regulator n=1 Tax=Pullulanibacillus pueri TaxID=1437324 RepID=A0A8J2ZVL8_9BACL|nr:AraC family transcriptional regulator [Pullulanibacillus pueri]MBM7682413.1 AraC-like DNA-binding protein [Pullulanibacillus pueri]GGH81737.1 AraC family transcriptional regulator [Pullulanibacillus pueri]
MTLIPISLSNYPNIDSGFPFHLSINKINHYFPPHRHDFLEFSLVLEGEGREVINGATHALLPGTFTFVSPYQIHEIHAHNAKPLTLYNCNFDLDLIMDANKKDSGLTSLLYNGMGTEERPSFIQLNQTQFATMKDILDSIYQEYQSEEEWRSLLIKAKVIEILILFDRFRQSRSQKTAVESIKNSGMIWPIVHYIHTHHDENITLGHLAKLFNLSVPYLSEQFKKFVGLNFVSFLHEVRIRHACSLLLSTDLSIADVSVEVGYQSFKTFSRVFRQKKGMTPTTFRKKKASLEHYSL